jgi:hypothetical protein
MNQPSSPDARNRARPHPFIAPTSFRRFLFFAARAPGPHPF